MVDRTADKLASVKNWIFFQSNSNLPKDKRKFCGFQRDISKIVKNAFMNYEAIFGFFWQVAEMAKLDNLLGI